MLGLLQESHDENPHEIFQFVKYILYIYLRIKIVKWFLVHSDRIIHHGENFDIIIIIAY